MLDKIFSYYIMGAGLRRSLRGGAKKSKKVVKKSRKTRKGGMLGTLKKFGKDVLTSSKEMLSKAGNLVKFKKGGKRKTLKKKYTKGRKGGMHFFVDCKDPVQFQKHPMYCSGTRAGTAVGDVGKAVASSPVYLASAAMSGGKRKTLKKKYTKAKKGGDVAFLAQHCKDENFRKAHTFECGPY